MADKYEATLVRGEVYFLGNKEFRKGVAGRVTQAEKEHLEKHAVDKRTVDNGPDPETREEVVFPKFTFVEIAAEPAAGGVAEAKEGEDDGGSDQGSRRTRRASRGL